MLIAQAFTEYIATAGLVAGLSEMSIRFEETVGGWGTESLVFVVMAFVLWRMLGVVR